MDILSNVLDVLSKEVQVDCDNIRTDLSQTKKKRSASGGSVSSKKKTRDAAVPSEVVRAQVQAGNAITSIAVDSKSVLAQSFRRQGEDYMLRAMVEEDTPVKVKLQKLEQEYYSKADTVDLEIASMKERLGRNLMPSFDASSSVVDDHQEEEDDTTC